MNLSQKLSEITSYFSPKIIGEVNDVYVKLVKIKGDKVPWHHHENEDELFHVLHGSLCFEIENQDPFTMNAGDLFIVKRGVNHRVSAVEECHLLLIENKTTQHTGNIITDITTSIQKQQNN